MNTRFTPPTTDVEYWANKTINNSGGGKTIVVPDGVKGWSWGAFLLNWIWAIGNETWVGLLMFVPVINVLVVIHLGINGRELAWRNKHWVSLERFQRVQRLWSIWGVWVTLIFMLMAGVAFAIFYCLVLALGGMGGFHG